MPAWNNPAPAAAARRPGTRTALFVAALLALVTPLLAASPASAARVGVVPDHAIGASYADARMDEYASWMGRPADVMLTYLGGSSWSEVAAQGARKARQLRGEQRHIVLSIPMPGSLSSVVRGDHDDAIRSIAQALVDNGLEETILRPGWEFNGRWFAWSAVGHEEEFAGAFRRIVQVMRTVPGQAFAFDWCMNRTATVTEAMYPGDDYVDIIGMDAYDQSYGPRVQSAEQRWQELEHGRFGLSWLRDFAARHDKPMSLPEWGVSTSHVRGTDPDNPLYIERMYDWFRDNDVAYASYFERLGRDRDARLMGDTLFPRSAAAYRRTFGGHPSGGSLAPSRRVTSNPSAPASLRSNPPQPPAVTRGDVATTPSGRGLWVAGSDGSVQAHGDAPDLGSLAGQALAQPIVGLASTPSGRGYWLVARDGGVFAFGEAAFLGSTGGIALNRPIVGMAATPSGGGYWLVASDGGMFSFGDAAFVGSTGGTPLTMPVVGMQPTPSGAGYWLVARDGGIFAFGDATFLGSTGAVRLNQPIVGMAGSPSGSGYRFVAADGGVFSFGDAGFHGSGAERALDTPVSGITPTSSGLGYWLVTTSGQLHAFGDAAALG